MSRSELVLDPDGVAMTRLAVSISGGLSATGCMIVLCLYVVFFWRQRLPLHLRMVMYLALADLLAALSAIAGANFHGAVVDALDLNSSRIAPVSHLQQLPGAQNYQLERNVGTNVDPRPDRSAPEAVGGTWCVATAALVQFFVLMSLLLAACIGHMLDSVVRRNDSNVERFEFFYIAFAIVVPAVTTAYCVLAGRFGDAGLWCWVQADGLGSGALVRFLCFYMWVIAVVLYLSFVSVAVYRKLSREWAASPRPLAAKRESSSVERTLQLISLAMVLLWIPGIANRIQNAVRPGTPVVALYLAHGIATPLQGLINSIIIGFNDEMRYQLKVKLSRFFTCCHPDATYLSVQQEEDVLRARLVREAYAYHSESDY